jgi:cytidine deaminase
VKAVPASPSRRLSKLPDVKDLVNAAAEARLRAYAPYSKYKVGAAAMSKDGRIWPGANVENASYPVGICAERAALTRMVNDGATELAGLAVVTEDGGAPCGMCLQFMLEFSTDPEQVSVLIKSQKTGEEIQFTLAKLIPHGFRRTAN